MAAKSLKPLNGSTEVKTRITYGVPALTAGPRLKPKHDLDLNEVDEMDEISGDEQLKSVWCRTCRAYEWHWIEV